MTLDQIKIFVAIAHHGSVRKAARALGKSQPALTATVSRLEASLGCELFIKGTRPLKLSSFGLRFLPRAMEFDEVLALTHTFSSKENVKKLRVCFDYGIALDEVNQLSQLIITDNSLRSIDLFRTDTATIHQLLIKQQCDLALTQPLSHLPPFLEAQHVGGREFVEVQAPLQTNKQHRMMSVHDENGQPLWVNNTHQYKDLISFNRPVDMLEALVNFYGKGWLPKGEVIMALSEGKVELTEKPSYQRHFSLVWQQQLKAEAKLVNRLVRYIQLNRS
ncbi:LysR family transcriptional regulator [Vibrio barjaei]|uniref:LysR family transcriptional regulator n=1 Tax=Vibrio barjaei TaxID=1676683 RepID=UPI0007BB8A8A|nr:LysR family transcriptional regulator [Vibrio barjaei]OIN25350.1 hypothetical protein AWH66_2017630 [Vibrio barjaei]